MQAFLTGEKIKKQSIIHNNTIMHLFIICEINKMRTPSMGRLMFHVTSLFIVTNK